VQTQPVRGQDGVQLLPRLRLLHLRLAATLDPSTQAFDAGMVLHVRRTVFCSDLARHVVVLPGTTTLFQAVSCNNEIRIPHKWSMPAIAGRSDPHGGLAPCKSSAHTLKNRSDNSSPASLSHIMIPSPAR
jgi:hypothetical protein